MLTELSLAVKQKMYRQRLERVVEPKLVMVDEQQEIEYNEAAEISGLNVSYEFVLNTLLKISPLSGRGLDICCGSGKLLLRIAKAMPEMHFLGVDLAEGMLRIAQRNIECEGLSNVQLQKHSMYELDSFPEKSFELVTWNNALHHCESADDALRVINSISRLVKDDGTVLIFDLCRLKTEELLIDLLTHTAEDLGDHFYNDTYDSYGAAFTFRELSEMLKRSALKDYKHVRPVCFDVVQVVYRSSTVNKNAARISHLISRRQRIDYALLKLSFLGRV